MLTGYNSVTGLFTCHFASTDALEICCMSGNGSTHDSNGDSAPHLRTKESVSMHEDVYPELKPVYHPNRWSQYRWSLFSWLDSEINLDAQSIPSRAICWILGSRHLNYIWKWRRLSSCSVGQLESSIITERSGYIHLWDLDMKITENTQTAKDYLSINIGWAAGTALGVWVSGGISGGHINPAVSYLSYPYLKSPTFPFRLLWYWLLLEGSPGKRSL